MIIWHYIWKIVRSSIPVGLMLIFVTLPVIPTQLPHYPEVAPMLTIAGIECLTIIHYHLVRSSIAFSIGLIEDLLTGTPLGSSAITLLCMQEILFSQKRFLYSRPFSIFWFVFSVTMLLSVILKTWIFLLYTQKKIYLTSLILSYITTILVYPAFKRLLLVIEAILMRGR